LLPSLSGPFLLVRDPFALYALWLGYPLFRYRVWSQWIRPLLMLGVLSSILAILAGHGDIFIAAYGARVLFIHLPLIFLFPIVFDDKDVLKFSWVLVSLAIPMTLLIVAQSYLPSTHILNIAPGGEGSAVFSGTIDRFRPPGIFSFVNGVAGFYTIAASALFSLLYYSPLNLFGRCYSVAVGIALVVAQPVSMSRSLLAGYLQVILALTTALGLSRAKILPVIAGFLGLFLAIFIGMSIPAFQETTDAFAHRWEAAAKLEAKGDARLGGAVGSFQNRFLDMFVVPFRIIDNVPFLGHGIGMSSNFASQRLTGGYTFLIGETSWEASLLEMGLPLGFAFLFWRAALSLWILRLALKQALIGNRLPMIWLGSSFLALIIGQIAQPTSLGFIVVSAGLTLAACKNLPHRL
jgi:hypothetical protein